MPRKKQPPPTVSQFVHLREQALEQVHQAEDLRRASDDLWKRWRRVAQRAIRTAKQHRAEGRSEDALQELRAALSVYPSAVVRLELAAAHLDLGQVAEAFGEYLRAIQADPFLADQYDELGAAFQQAGMMELLLAPLVAAFGQDRVDRLQAAAVFDPVDTFLQRWPKGHRYYYRSNLESFFPDLRPAGVWEALSVPTEELVDRLSGMHAWGTDYWFPPSRQCRATVNAFLRFCRNLGYLPDDPELNEYLDEEETDTLDLQESMVE